MINFLSIVSYMLIVGIRMLVNIKFLSAFYSGAKKNKVLNIIIILSYISVSTINFLVYDNIYYFYFINVMFIIFATYIFDITFQIRIISALAATIFTILFDSIVFRTFILLTAKPYSHYFTNLIISTLILIFAYIFDRYFTYNENDNISYYRLLIVLTSPLASLIIFTVIYINEISIIGGFLTTLSLILLNFFTFYSYSLFTKLTRAQAENDALEILNNGYKTQIEIIQKSREDILALKHDMKNHILANLQLIENKEYETLEENLNFMQSTLESSREWSHTENNIIDGILNYKLSYIDNLGTDINCTIKLPTDEFMPLFDLTVIFGNLLDNVYEALQSSKNKILVLDVLYSKNVLYINCKNTYYKKPIPSDEFFISTKNDSKKQGLGLKNINKIVQKYNGELNLSVDDEFFITDILIYL